MCIRDRLATVVGAKKVNPDMDYFPLSVNYQEKYYAAGKFQVDILKGKQDQLKVKH